MLKIHNAREGVQFLLFLLFLLSLCCLFIAKYDNKNELLFNY
jgi:hypothetical protein